MTVSEMEPIVITGSGGGTPAAHAATHASGGTDPVTVAQSQVTGLTAALAGKATDTAVVHLTGTETVAGTKTFTANPTNMVTLALGTNPASTGMLRLPNSQAIYGRNAANDGNINIMYVDGANSVVLGDSVSPQVYIRGGALTLSDPGNLVLGSTTGTKIATAATQKLAFYGATPIVRPASTPAAAVDPATTMALVNDLRTKLIALGLIA